MGKRTFKLRKDTCIGVNDLKKDLKAVSWVEGFIYAKAPWTQTIQNVCKLTDARNRCIFSLPQLPNTYYKCKQKVKKLTNILKSHRARSHENHVKCGLEASLAECCSSFEQKVIESLACAISFLGTRATARMKANKGLFPWNSLSISKQPEINIAHPQTKQTKKPLTKSIRTMPEISSG